MQMSGINNHSETGLLYDRVDKYDLRNADIDIIISGLKIGLFIGNLLRTTVAERILSVLYLIWM